jgi:hypothetical protein
LRLLADSARARHAAERYVILGCHSAQQDSHRQNQDFGHFM